MPDERATFAADVRSELSGVAPARHCCQVSELGGLLRGAGVSPASGIARLQVAEPVQARAAVRLVHALTGPGIEVRIERRAHRLSVMLPLQRVAASDLTAMGRAPVDPCCQKAFLRGVYLLRGYVMEPTTGYHLEVVLRSAATAELVRRLLNGWEIPAGVVGRRARHLVYVKGSENVGRTLGLMGSSRGLMRLEGLRVFSSLRNDVNRRLNFETANLRRGAESALAQLEAVQRLEDAGRLESLPPALREAAGLRRRHPRAGLSELARATGLGKSQLNHRLRRLVALAAASQAVSGQ